MKGSLLALVFLTGSSVAIAGEYQLDSTEWNGLSQLRDLAHGQGCAVHEQATLDWRTLDPGQDALWLLYPLAPVEAQRVGQFLSEGGSVLLADDFGGASALLASFGITRRNEALPADVPRWQGRGELPMARSVLGTALGRSAAELTTNHPAWFDSALPATFSFVGSDESGASRADARALVIEGRVGAGHLVALADPSVLINDMQSLPGNSSFARQLVSELCGRHGITLVTGRFVSQPAPKPWPLTELARPLEALKRAAGEGTRALDNLLASPASRAILGSGFGVLCLLLFGGSFPRPARLAARWGRLADGLSPDPDTPLGEGPEARGYALQLLDGWLHERWALPRGPLDRAARKRLSAGIPKRVAALLITLDKLRQESPAPSARALYELYASARSIDSNPPLRSSTR